MGEDIMNEHDKRCIESKMKLYDQKQRIKELQKPVTASKSSSSASVEDRLRKLVPTEIDIDEQMCRAIQQKEITECQNQIQDGQRKLDSLLEVTLRRIRKGSIGSSASVKHTYDEKCILAYEHKEIQ